MEEKILNEIHKRIETIRNSGIRIRFLQPVDEKSRGFAIEVEYNYGFENWDKFQFLFNDLNVKYDLAFETSYMDENPKYVMFTYKY